MNDTHPINIDNIQPMVIDIDFETKNNKYYRSVIHTGIHSKLVLMSIEPGNNIVEEIHFYNDQFIKIESGSGYAKINGEFYPIHNGISIDIPSGSIHDIINNSTTKDLKLYTIYSPPLHKNNELKIIK